MAQLGPYRLGRELGRGGMGAVYEAEDTRSGARVALKVLLELDPELLERFRREGSSLLGIEHPNLVRVLEVSVAPPRPYVAFELIGGETLAQRVRREGPLPWPTAVHVAAEVAAGLAVAHAHGLLHRDIKPQNVLLGARGAQLADFGLVRPQDARSLTETGMILGTPGYLAPEQALAERGSSTPATDVYGLAATLYFALTGRAPFVGTTVVGTLGHVVQSPAPSPRATAPDVPAWLDALCLQGLAKDPQERPPSAEALREALLAGGGRPPSRRAWALGVGLAVAAGGLSLGLALLAGGRAPEEPEAVAPGASDVSPTPSAVGGGEVGSDRALPEPQGSLAVARGLLSQGRRLEALSVVERALERPGGEEASLRALRADLLAQAGRWPEALDEFRRLAELVPDDPRAWLGQAECLTASLDHSGSLEALNRALELDPQHVRARTLHADLQGRLGNVRAALKEAEALLAENPGNGRAHSVRGMALAREQGNQQEVVAALDAAVTLGEDGPELRLTRARAQLQLEQVQAGLTDLDVALRLSPRFRPARLLRAKVLLRQKRFDLAIQDARVAYDQEREASAAAILGACLNGLRRFDDALGAVLGFEDLESLRVRAAALQGLGRVAAALEVLNAILEADPGSLNARLQRAEVHDRLGNWGEVVLDLNPVLRKHPDLVRALILRGYALARGEERGRGIEEGYPPDLDAAARANLVQARADLDRALEEDPSSARALMARGRFAAYERRYDEALADLRRIPERERTEQILGLTGLLLSFVKRFEEALVAYDAALARAPESSFAQLNRATARLALGRAEEALEDCATLLDREQDSARLREIQGRAFALLGRPEEAERAYTRSLELDPARVDALARRAWVLHAQGRDAAALRDAREALGRLQALRSVTEEELRELCAEIEAGVR